MYKKLFNTLLAIFLLTFPIHVLKAQSDKTLIMNTIHQFFDGMRQNDPGKIREVLAKDVRFLTVIEQKGAVMLPEVKAEDFLQTVSLPRSNVLDERLESYEIKVDDRLTSVWTTYQFYLGDVFSHCGVNAFQLYKSYQGWKILQITDTRRVERCP
jgi:hypothetical protein